jgi:hypothetical protein
MWYPSIHPNDYTEEKMSFTPTAKIIADSICKITDKRLTTLEVEFNRFVLAEFNTHRALSRNGSSSRAIPVQRATEIVNENPGLPVFWAQNKPGMAATEELSGDDLVYVQEGWDLHRALTTYFVLEMSERGLHKQLANRLLENHGTIKMVVSATEWENFFWLRCDGAAQQEMSVLADKVREAMADSIPVVLDAGEWHTPYFKAGFWRPDMEEPLEDALSISASCCAQVSYRRTDDSLEKAKDVAKKLFEGARVHSSPTEHQGSPMIPVKKRSAVGANWQKGVTHLDRFGAFWSGNLCGWIQNRQLIENNVKRG